ncbi:MAG: NAD-dependent epimerase/dehydratase family protein [Anaerolineales bacterium]|nr:NAD-dependent epimerase/dehydratase family protein [Anaerolineales bacterium]
MSRYLLTGSAGFIASNVAHQLLDLGHEVIGVDNMNDAYDVRLKTWRLEKLEERDGFIFFQLDICDKDALASVFDHEFDAVLNLAARAGVRQSVRDPWIYFQTNLTGALNLLDLSVKRGVSKFVQASTSSLYGSHNPRPFRENADISKPLSPYAASKGASEMLCHSYHHLYGIDVTVLRYFTVFGPAGRPDMSIFRFVQWVAEGRPVIVYGDGHQERDFTYVSDIARGTISAIQPVGFEVINLGSDRPFVLLDVLRKIEALLGKNAEIEWRDAAPADVRATWADIHKAGEVLNWEPQISLEKGLEACIAWYETERHWANQVNTSDA